MKSVWSILRIIPGLVFLFSGFVKIIDPVGSGLIMDSYFNAAGINSPEAISVSLALLLSVAELITGISLVSGLKLKYSIPFSLLLMVFFTILTLILYIFNPVTDCGCFGEALKLTNGQTFLKNVILLILVFFLFICRSRYEPVAPPKYETVFMTIFGVLVIILSIYSLRNLPLMDFLQFKPGYNIREGISDNDESVSQNFKTILTYSKNGEIRDYTIENLPDSTWIFVDSKTISEKNKVGSHFLRFEAVNSEGEYLTDSLLNNKSGSIWFSVLNFNKIHKKNLDSLSSIINVLNGAGIKSVVLTSSHIDSLSGRFNSSGIDIKPLFVDYKTLVSLNRASLGATYVKDGEVVKKWVLRRLDTGEILKINKEDHELVSAREMINQQLSVEIIAVLFVALLFIFRQVCKLVFIKKVTEYANRIEQEY